MLAFGMFSMSYAAITIEPVGDGSGYDLLGAGTATDQVSAFRTASVTKTFDVDGDNIYGTAGSFFFGADDMVEGTGLNFSEHTQTDVSWATFANAGGVDNIREFANTINLDDPALTTGADRNLNAFNTRGDTGNAGAWGSILSFDFTAATPDKFRIGIWGGNEATEDDRWDPTGYRLSADGGTTWATVTGLEASGDIGGPDSGLNIVFFDVDLAGAETGTILIANQQRTAKQGGSIAGVTFDEVASGSETPILRLSAETLSLDLLASDTSTNGTITASYLAGTSSSNDIQIVSISTVQTNGFSGSVVSNLLGTANIDEAITVIYANSGALVNDGDTTNNTLTVTWTAVGSGVTNTSDVAVDVTYIKEASLLDLTPTELSLTLNIGDTSTNGTAVASFVSGTLSTDVEVISVVATNGFSAAPSSFTLSTGNVDEEIVITYVNSGSLTTHGDTAESTVVITWTESGSGVTNTTEATVDVLYIDADAPVVMNFNLGETANDYETLDGEIWNNIYFDMTSDFGSFSAIEDIYGVDLPGISISVDAPLGGRNSEDLTGEGYIAAALDSMTTSLVYNNQGAERITVAISGLEPDSVWNIDLFAGLPSTANRWQDIYINSNFVEAVDTGINGTYAHHAPLIYTNVFADADGVLEIAMDAATNDTTHEVAFIQGVILRDSTVNAAPYAYPQDISLYPGSTTNITLFGIDANGTELIYTLASMPTNGTLVTNVALPNVTYTPDDGYMGADSFTFSVSDGELSSATVTVSMMVMNQTPVADAQSVSTTPDTAVEITLSGSDGDSWPSNLTYSVETLPVYGTFTGASNVWIYTPTNGYQGADSFTFTVNDGALTSEVATVSIAIANVVPVADAQSVETAIDTALEITLTGSDEDAWPSNLTYSVETFPVYGSLIGSSNVWTYTPSNAYVGADSFTFLVNDGLANSAAATVSIDVVNSLPVADAQGLFVAPNTPLAITLTGSDSDGPSNLTYTVQSMPVSGTLVTNGALPNLTYTPTNGFAGADSFTFIVNDGVSDSATATISITVANAATDVIAGYDFDDGTGTATTAVTVEDALVTASSFGVGAGLIDLINQDNGNCNFSYLDAETNLFGTANGFDYGGAQTTFGFPDMNDADNMALAISNNDYMTFTVTPDSGYELDLSKFTFRTRVNSVQHSAERWALFSSVDGFTTNDVIAVGQTMTVNTYVNNVVDLSAAEFQNLSEAVEFRLVIYGGDQSQSSATLFDKVIVKGTVEEASAVEDPVISASVSGSSLSLVWDGGGTYNVLTNANLLNAEGWGVATNGTSPIDLEIGSDSELFYKLESE
jgi:hypothetical protein